jgi:outer membrane protein TolC
MTKIRLALTTTTLAVLAGCASFSPDGGMTRVSELTQERTGQPVAFQRSESDADTARARVAVLLEQPLTADAAVEVALLNNRGLQARLGDLGIAEADLVQAGRLRNPVFSFGRLAGGGALEIDRSVMFDLLGLLTLPARSQVAQRRFEQAQFQAAADAVDLGSQARNAFFDAVAAQQLAAYAQQVMEAAQASSDLAQRMAQAGNLSRLDQMREQAFFADATTGLARSRQQAVAARERLVRALGLTGDEAGFELPERLPELPAAPAEIQDAERIAMGKRLDLSMARRDVEATARELGLTQAIGFVNVLDAGWQNKSQRGVPTESGYELQVEVPIFDFGGPGRARAQARYMQAVNRAAAVAVDARSEVREACLAYRTAYDLARHYRDDVVPLRKRISDENLLRYNGMLIDVFALLADAREQVTGVTASVQASRDFWVAQTDLQTALMGRSPGTTRAGASSPVSTASE